MTVKDSQGRTFDSIETLQVDWTLSDSGLASLAQPKGTLSQVLVPSLRTVYSGYAVFWIRICGIRKFLGLPDQPKGTLSQVPVPKNLMGSVVVYSGHAVFWIRICRIRKFLGLTDPDPLVGAQRYGSGSFFYQAI